MFPAGNRLNKVFWHFKQMAFLKYVNSQEVLCSDTRKVAELIACRVLEAILEVHCPHECEWSLTCPRTERILGKRKKRKKKGGCTDEKRTRCHKQCWTEHQWFALVWRVFLFFCFFFLNSWSQAWGFAASEEVTDWLIVSTHLAGWNNLCTLLLPSFRFHSLFHLSHVSQHPVPAAEAAWRVWNPLQLLFPFCLRNLLSLLLCWITFTQLSLPLFELCPGLIREAN